MRLEHTLTDPTCRGIDRMDFSADGRYAFASCEFAGRMIKIDLTTLKVVSTLVLANGYSSPQDVKLIPRRNDPTTRPTKQAAGCGKSTPTRSK